MKSSKGSFLKEMTCKLEIIFILIIDCLCNSITNTYDANHILYILELDFIATIKKVLLESFEKCNEKLQGLILECNNNLYAKIIIGFEHILKILSDKKEIMFILNEIFNNDFDYVIEELTQSKKIYISQRASRIQKYLENNKVL